MNSGEEIDRTQRGSTELAQADQMFPNIQKSSSGKLDLPDHKSSWSHSEDSALEAISRFEGQILIDLDETLYLENSTETFLSLAVPGLLAAYILRVLDLISPWRKIGGFEARDNWRLMTILIFFPWTYLRWVNYCKQTAPHKLNVKLADALRSRGEKDVIVSNGFQLIIRPLVVGLNLSEIDVICCRVLRLKDRSQGKLALAVRKLGLQAVKAAMVVTDSLKDAEILSVCKYPCLVVWREAVFRRAFDKVAYLPGDYLIQVKRPKQGALRKLVREDLFVWIAVALTVTDVTWWQVLGIILLFASMWSVYEIGYYDNDFCAKHFESDPKLNPRFDEFNGQIFVRKAWFFGLITGVTGTILISGFDDISKPFVWCAVLISLRGTYWLYNRVDKNTRIWIYLILQIFRSASMIAIVGISLFGFAICLSQVITRWLDYIIYRSGKIEGQYLWPKTPNRSIRFILLVLFISAIILSTGPASLYTLALVIVPWFAYLAVLYEMRDIVSGAHRIDEVKR
ncbi:hypothetical protein [Methylobacterium iners]|uniref:Haloacid dehalogenase-like hydrolase n=1 Tax=Methylobacterium iners TaxID=418707 RepID=A0ABQ4S666_9HYPH|nr:hypothetical protein [Methylobacterium iners]GJD97978.1 hypothetical protein OCOJLMKI_5217 [Methylobacterium iners]